MKVVVAEKISSSAVDLLREPRWNIVTADQLDGKLASQLESADALIVRSAVQVNAELLEHAHKLRVIGRAGVGVDNIDLDAATRKGIAVMNTPGANAIAVAEHTLALMLAMARHIGRANELMHAGKWEKKSLQGTELRGKTIGIVGLGRVGMEVARRARAFGMEVVAHDPFVSTAVAKEQGICMAKLEEVYSDADYLSLHVGLTPQTAGMINAESIKKMKQGVRLVNCARGELIDEAALAQGLKQGRVAGAALDVFTEEPPKNSPLTAIENVILTPHIAGSTYEAQEAVGYQIAHQVKEYLKDGVIQNAVNVPSVSHDEYLELQPYIVLAERLGAFLAQVSDGTLEEISYPLLGPHCGRENRVDSQRRRQRHSERSFGREGEPGERGCDCVRTGPAHSRIAQAKEFNWRLRQCALGSTQDGQRRACGQRRRPAQEHPKIAQRGWY